MSADDRLSGPLGQRLRRLIPLEQLLHESELLLELTHGLLDEAGDESRRSAEVPHVADHRESLDERLEVREQLEARVEVAVRKRALRAERAIRQTVR
jgi:hypothetical protein